MKNQTPTSVDDRKLVDDTVSKLPADANEAASFDNYVLYNQLRSEYDDALSRSVKRASRLVVPGAADSPICKLPECHRPCYQTDVGDYDRTYSHAHLQLLYRLRTMLSTQSRAANTQIPRTVDSREAITPTSLGGLPLQESEVCLPTSGMISGTP